MRRFFYDTAAPANTASPTPLASAIIDTTIELPASVVHHWCRVLRAKSGDEAVLFDGLGGEYYVRLNEVTKKRATVDVLGFNAIERAPHSATIIGLVMSRGDRMDYAIQKATELGVSAIQLLTSHHGEVHLKPAQIPKKCLHWQQVAIAACEQSGLNRPPLILAPRAIEDWLNFGIDQLQSHGIKYDQVAPIAAPLLSQPFYQALSAPPDLRLMLVVPQPSCEVTPTKAGFISDRISQLRQTARPVVHLLIGPEGGFSDQEQQLARQAGFDAWQIGDRILRTETAPVVALATLHTLCS